EDDALDADLPHLVADEGDEDAAQHRRVQRNRRRSRWACHARRGDAHRRRAALRGVETLRGLATLRRLAATTGAAPLGTPAAARGETPAAARGDALRAGAGFAVGKAFTTAGPPASRPRMRTSSLIVRSRFSSRSI